MREEIQALGAYGRQVLGPSWLDQNEYDIEARTGEQANREQLDLILRALLAERFTLWQYREMTVIVRARGAMFGHLIRSQKIL